MSDSSQPANLPELPQVFRSDPKKSKINLPNSLSKVRIMFGVIGFLVMAVGVGLAVNLSQQQQTASSRASESSPSVTPDTTLRTKYLVKPYLIYPSDKPMYPEYEQAVRAYLIELQSWYLANVGKTFTMAPLQVIRTPENYLTLRCGDKPSEKCKNDPSILDGNTGYYMNRAIHNGEERWEEQTAALVFSAGAGGYAGANFYPNDAGFAIVGDWVLEPISGKANDWGIPCKYASWQCDIKVARGTPAHELTHSFGLDHPDPNLYKKGSVMIWHGDYPEVSFLPHEVDYLRQSPFLNPQTGVNPSASVAPVALPTSSAIVDPPQNPIQLILHFFGDQGQPNNGDQNEDGKINELDFGAAYRI